MRRRRSVRHISNPEPPAGDAAHLRRGVEHLASGRAETTLVGHAFWVTAYAVTPDGPGSLGRTSPGRTSPGLISGAADRNEPRRLRAACPGFVRISDMSGAPVGMSWSDHMPPTCGHPYARDAPAIRYRPNFRGASTAGAARRRLLAWPPNRWSPYDRFLGSPRMTLRRRTVWYGQQISFAVESSRRLSPEFETRWPQPSSRTSRR
jgi:hypothetical protein